MTKILYGERLGRQAKLSVGCSATIFDRSREKVLLTRRSDNGLWCLPGGHMDPGESTTEACIREVQEETGLEARVVRLIGIYTDPNRITEYADGNRYQMVALNFEAETIGGELSLSDETTDYGYFSPAEMAGLELMPNHEVRIADSFAGVDAAFVR